MDNARLLMGWVHYFFHHLLFGVCIEVLVMAGDFFFFFLTRKRVSVASVDLKEIEEIK